MIKKFKKLYSYFFLERNCVLLARIGVSISTKMMKNTKKPKKKPLKILD